MSGVGIVRGRPSVDRAKLSRVRFMCWFCPFEKTVRSRRFGTLFFRLFPFVDTQIPSIGTCLWIIIMERSSVTVRDVGHVNVRGTLPQTGCNPHI